MRADGSISAWGDDDHGEVSGATGISNAVKVAAGYRYSLALLEDGTVVGWGTNSHGQLNVPTNVTNVVAATAIDGGIYHSVAVRADGSVVAWGSSEYGELDVPVGLSRGSSVAASGYYSLAQVSLWAPIFG